MRKQKKPLFLLVSLTILIAIAGGGCNSTAGENQTTPTTNTSAQAIHDISAAEAYALIRDNKDNPDFIIIDVRTPDEYAAGHLENSKLIDYDNKSFSTEISKLDRNKKYLIYCRTGNRSARYRVFLASAGPGVRS